MAYSRKLWQDHVVEFPTRFQQNGLGNNLVNSVPSPGEIIQQGTPQNAANFNNNEEGTFAANEMADFLFLQVLQINRGLRAAIGESGTIALTNTQTFPFNNSGSTVALKTQRDTTDYTVTLEVVSVTGGAVGEIRIANKLRNGFQLSFSGSASQVVVRYNVT